MTFVLAIALAIGLAYLMGKPTQFLTHRLNLLSVAHAVPVAVGAYSYSRLAVMNLWPWPAALAGILAGGVAGGLLVLASARLSRSDYSLFSFCVQLVATSAALNIRSFTGGALGITGVPSLQLPWGQDRLSSAVWLVIPVACAVAFGYVKFSGRPFAVCGSVLARSEELASTLGLPTARLRLCYGFGHGCILGCAGVLTAGYLSITDPSQFGVALSVVILVISMFGVSRWRGPLVGAILLAGVPELVRLFGWSSEQAAALQLVAAGGIGVVFSFFVFGARGSDL